MNRNAIAILCIVGLVTLAAVNGVRLANRAAEPGDQDTPARTEADIAADTAAVLADIAPDAVSTEDAATEALTPVLALPEFASQCLSAVRTRNPRGRLVKLNANRLANRCAAIVETDHDSQRWLFDWRDGEAGFVHKGEVRLPDSWPAQAPIAIELADYTPEKVAAQIAAAHALWPDSPHDEWLYEIISLPEPFARPLAFITFSDTAENAEPYAGYTVIYEGSRQLDDAEFEQALALYPITRFELREDHNFKGPLFESTALAEAATSLETDPEAGPPSAVAINAEACMGWLHKVNTGSRVLRVAMDRQRCYLILENAAQRDDFYLLTTTGDDALDENPSLQMDTRELPNLLLDRSRLTSARVRERLGQAQALAGTAAIDRIAIAWVNGAMVWQFTGQSAADAPVWLDENGKLILAPPRFPISRAERDQGFAPSEPTLDVAAEAAN